MCCQKDLRESDQSQFLRKNFASNSPSADPDSITFVLGLLQTRVVVETRGSQETLVLLQQLERQL